MEQQQPKSSRGLSYDFLSFTLSSRVLHGQQTVRLNTGDSLSSAPSMND